MAASIDSRHLIHKNGSVTDSSDQGSEDSASILASVREQEHQFAQLTREIEEEKALVARQLNQSDNYGSENEMENSLRSPSINSDMYYTQSPDAYVSHQEEYDDPHEETEVLIDENGVTKTITKRTVTKTVTEQRVRHIEQPGNNQNGTRHTAEPTYASVNKKRPKNEDRRNLLERNSSSSSGEAAYRNDARRQTPEKFQPEQYGLEDDGRSDESDVDAGQYGLEPQRSYQTSLKRGSVSSASSVDSQRYADDQIDGEVPVAAPRAGAKEPIGRAPLAMQESGSRASLDQLGAGWHTPTLEEVVKMLTYNMGVVQQNAAAYIQHLCFNNAKIKADVRSLGGIPPLVRLLDHPNVDVQLNSCGALRNLCFGSNNDRNKLEMKNCEGVPAVVRLVRAAKTTAIKEQATGTLWNLSAHPDLKGQVLELGLEPLTNLIIIPFADAVSKQGGKAKDIDMLDVFTNAVGVVRNLSSSESSECRRRLRECEDLVYSLFTVLQINVENGNTLNKATENCVCVLRNLSYKLQDETPNFEQLYMMEPAPKQDESSGGMLCFGKPKNKGGKQPEAVEQIPPNDPDATGAALLWQPEITRVYVALLVDSQKHTEITEATLGAIQNLTCGVWKWAVYSRAVVRKEKGLPVIIDRLRTDKDQVVRAGAIALTNLAEDGKNKDLIGKFAMKDLVYKLPGGSDPNIHHSDTTVIAVLNTIRLLVDANSDNVRHLRDAAGVERVTTINNARDNSRFHARVIKAAGQVLKAVWANKETQSVLKKDGWNKNHFTPTVTIDTLPRTKATPASPSQGSAGGRRAQRTQGGDGAEFVQLQSGGRDSERRKAPADSWV